MADLTIYTDASLYRKVGAWAAVWETDEFEIGCGDLLTGDQPNCSAIMEINAIGLAIDVAVRVGDARPGGRIVVYTDNATAIMHLNGHKFRRAQGKQARASRQLCEEAAQRVRDVASRHMITLVLKKVAAHVPLHRNPTVHELANRKADRIARKIVRTEIKRRKNGKASIL